MDEPAAVTTIGRDELDRAPDVLPDDVLRSAPSVGLFRRSASTVADPTSQGINLRGLGPSGVSRALVLFDGVPLNDAFGGWVYWRELSLPAIERIAIEPSGASAQFGNFGLGGVVSITSRPADPPRIDAMIAGGSLGTALGAVRASDSFKGLGIAVDASALRTSGYTPVADYARGAADEHASSHDETGGARLDYTHGRDHVRAFGRGFAEDLDAGTQNTTATVRSVRYGAGYTHDGDAGQLDVSAFGATERFSQERARVAPDRSMATLASTQHTPSNSQGGSVRYTAAPLASNSLQVGADAMRVDGTATDTIANAMPTATSLATRSGGGTQHVVGAFVQDTAHIGARLDVMAAVRVDHVQDLAGQLVRTLHDGTQTITRVKDTNDTQLDPRVGALLHVDEEFSLRGSFYRAFRAPTLNELYRPFQVGTILTDANPTLTTEHAWGAEFGPQVATGPLEARATAFWASLSDPVFNATLATPNPDGATRERENLGHARVAGAELELAWHPAAAWTAIVAYTFIDAHATAGPLTGLRLAQDPHHRATASLAYDDPKIVTATAEIRYTSRQFEDDLNTLPMGAFTVVDIFAQRAILRGFRAFAMVDNLFDTKYLVGRSGIDTVGAPRTVLVGLAWSAQTPPGAR
ncbi:MAG TPA: TonB-dependent receptor [Kofleriaceae bacterium]